MLPQPHGHVTLPYSTSEHQVVFKAARHPASDTSDGYHDMDVIKDKMMWLSVATQRSIIQYSSFSSPLLKWHSGHGIRPARRLVYIAHLKQAFRNPKKGQSTLNQSCTQVSWMLNTEPMKIYKYLTEKKGQRNKKLTLSSRLISWKSGLVLASRCRVWVKSKSVQK